MAFSSRSVVRQRMAGILAFCVLALACLASQAARLAAPGPNDHYVAKAVTSQLKRDHLRRHPLDAEVAERCFKTFLKELDPMKMYFYQSDYDEFAQSKDKLAEMIEAGDITFAYKLYNRFLDRIDERVKMIDQILATKQDFTVDEEMVVDKDAVQYPKTPEEAYDRWRKRIKYDLLLLKADKAEEKGDKADTSEGKTPEQRLSKRYHSFAKRMGQTDEQELLEMYLTSLTTSLDPHTTYMSKDTVKDFEIMMQLKLEGIGASLQGVDGYTVVKKIIPGGAAEKESHLKLEDKIIGVGQGDSGELVDVVDMKLRDVVKMIRGNRGTIVRLQLISLKDPKPHTIKITREEIQLKDSEAQGKVFEAGRGSNGKPYKVGVINLPSFYMDMEAARHGDPNYKSTTRDVRNILEEFKNQGVDAVVMDLRTNGGGSLSEAITLTGLFLKDGPVVQVKDADKRVQSYDDHHQGIEWNGPLVVVISKFSASASEIFAGAIQDYGRGLIVGDVSTHGKGTVQSLQNLSDVIFRGIPNAPEMGELKITIQQFYRPGGDSTQLRGVLSDIELPSLSSHYKDISEADMDYPLPFDHVDSQQFVKFDEASPAVVNQLKRLSAARCAASPKFQKVQRNIAHYQQQIAKKSVTLNEAKFLKERSELNADKEEEKAIENLQDTSGIKRDFYLDEVLSITSDYMNQTPVAKAG
jgi:carboxyl-terminal processing protease